ncbi:MAG: hypothetical protein LBN20_03255 [Endomicrobium sp.]|nr:hypothetical protein [Endomicrobium sp.]
MDYQNCFKKRRGYFLICGHTTDFNYSFLKESKPTSDNLPSGQNYQSAESEYEKWFSFNLSDSNKEIAINKADVLFNEFTKDYPVDDNINYPSKITTTLLYLSEQDPDDKVVSYPSPMKIGIWEIKK